MSQGQQRSFQEAYTTLVKIREDLEANRIPPDQMALKLAEAEAAFQTGREVLNRGFTVIDGFTGQVF